MSHPSTSRRRWRRTALATAGVSLIAAVSPMIGANPAAAATAPLVTEDGIGIRIDENAILGPALDLIEAELQPYVNDRIYQGAWENSVMDDPDWVQGSANVDLSFDFIEKGTGGFTEGGLKVRADLKNIMMRFYRYGAWWQPECQFRVNPDDGWINASARINTALLPGSPLQIDPISAYWDTSPNITREIGGILCDIYLFDEWWDGLWGNSTDVAAQLEDELDDIAQDLVDNLWTDYVTPVVDSLAGFGITFGQVRTDDHGLIVTADVNAGAGGGITLPGIGGPFDVTDTEDAGITHDVNTVLAQTDREVIATIHPNVVSHFMNALNQAIDAQYGQYLTAGSVESVLVPPAVYGDYNDAGWALRLTAMAPPRVDDTGTDGRPQLVFPDIELRFYNTSKGPFAPVATFRGTLGALDLLTVNKGATWGPTYSSANATLSGLTRTQANVDASMMPVPSASAILPNVKVGFDHANADIIEEFIDLPPLTIGGLSVSLCSCTRLTGDQRYTEYFNVA